MAELKKDVLTTGEVAKICNVAPRTVSKWFDSGQLRGYRIPGSKDRRIPLAQLIKFMQANGMPLDSLDAGQVRILVIDQDTEYTATLTDRLGEQGRYEVQTATSAFAAGLIASNHRPHILLVDIRLPGISAREMGRALRASDTLQSARLIAMGNDITPQQGEKLKQEGFDAWISRPFEIEQLTSLVGQIMPSSF